MTTGQANLVVDIQCTPAIHIIDTLTNEVGALPGISRIQASDRSSRLLLIDYDPQQTGSRDILNAFVQRGYHARLIGM